MTTAGLVSSTGSVGDAYDHAVVESFFATLKTELLDRQTWPSRTATERAIFASIETWYNRRRLHSTLGYLTPITFEAQCLALANHRVVA